MATVQLRDIVTPADRVAALRVRAGSGQDRFVASVEESFADAVRDARACPRFWSVTDGDEVVGFVMISDGIPAERVAADPELVGPYFLWRLLIDADHQRRGYGTAVLDAIVAYLRDRPGADVLYTLPPRAMARRNRSTRGTDSSRRAGSSTTRSCLRWTSPGADAGRRLQKARPPRARGGSGPMSCPPGIGAGDREAGRACAPATIGAHEPATVPSTAGRH